jgi:hypothetical protein
MHEAVTVFAGGAGYGHIMLSQVGASPIITPLGSHARLVELPE